MNDCQHCDLERARLRHPAAHVRTPKGGPLNPMSLLLDGDPNARPTTYPADDIIECGCRCHDLWLFANRGVL